jgi:hypothetical protein
MPLFFSYVVFFLLLDVIIIPRTSTFLYAYNVTQIVVLLTE